MGNWTDGDILICPVCGDVYSHIREVATRLGSDEHEAKVYAGTRVTGLTADRRSALVVALDGECGHHWNVVVQQHKGVNSIKIEVVTEVKGL